MKVSGTKEEQVRFVLNLDMSKEEAQILKGMVQNYPGPPDQESLASQRLREAIFNGLKGLGA